MDLALRRLRIDKNKFFIDEISTKTHYFSSFDKKLRQKTNKIAKKIGGNKEY